MRLRVPPLVNGGLAGYVNSGRTSARDVGGCVYQEEDTEITQRRARQCFVMLVLRHHPILIWSANRAFRDRLAPYHVGGLDWEMFGYIVRGDAPRSYLSARDHCVIKIRQSCRTADQEFGRKSLSALGDFAKQELLLRVASWGPQGGIRPFRTLIGIRRKKRRRRS